MKQSGTKFQGDPSAAFGLYISSGLFLKLNFSS